MCVCECLTFCTTATSSGVNMPLSPVIIIPRAFTYQPAGELGARGGRGREEEGWR